MWVNTPTSRTCTIQHSLCSAAGVYSPNSSSTYNYLSSNFNITYGDGTFAIGDYATDTVAFGSTTIKDLQFGIGYRSTSAQGILGIGYTANEASISTGDGKSYQNFPAKLAAQGTIASNAYSIWLNDLAASTGKILFGGIDKAQYHEPLVALPVQKSAGNQYKEFLITMTGFALNETTVQNDMALAVLLDTGTSLTYLPNNIVSQVYDALGATWDQGQEMAFVPCHLAKYNTTFTFSFSSPARITVPISEMVINATNSRGRELTFTNNEAACILGISPAGEHTMILGDTFLRSAYVVYDLDKNQISLAQSKVGATSGSSVSDIVEIGSASASVTTAATAVSAKSGVPSADSGAAVIEKRMGLMMGALAAAVYIAL